MSQGTKEGMCGFNSLLLKDLLDLGITVAATNYRLSGTAPFPAQMHDAARLERQAVAERWRAAGGEAPRGVPAPGRPPLAIAPLFQSARALLSIVAPNPRRISQSAESSRPSAVVWRSADCAPGS